jgi:hypothetical protein
MCINTCTLYMRPMHRHGWSDGITHTWTVTTGANASPLMSRCHSEHEWYLCLNPREIR